MAHRKIAKAHVVHPKFGIIQWDNFTSRFHSRTAGSANLVTQASEILGEDFDPKKYLLTHSTIVASVDTVAVPNVKLGTMVDSETGNPITRKWNDYRISTETLPWINGNCFVPGTMVTMEDGTVKPIEDICEGDRVLTHMGRARRVVRTMRRDVDEEILAIRRAGTSETLYTTKEHPFFVFRENRCPTCEGLPRRKSGYNSRCITHIIGKFYCSASCWRAHQVSTNTLLEAKTGEFVEAQDLHHRDFAATPLLTEEKSSPIDMTLGKARLIGLFAAEGYYELASRRDNKRVGVCWAFHEEERDTLANQVKELLASEFGVQAVIREHSKDRGIHVTTRTNPEMVDFFRTWVKGDGSKTKTLAKGILSWGSSLQEEVLRGWFEGDGCLIVTKKKNVKIRLSGTTSSPSLANQIQIILRGLNVQNRLFRSVTPGRKRLSLGDKSVVVEDFTKECVAWTVSCGAHDIHPLVQGSIYEDRFLEAWGENGGYQKSCHLRFLNGYELQLIQSIEPMDYTGPVYNIEVEEDHSYLAGGVAVHNCDAWDRKVLLKSYRTFVGAQNFLEHVQVESQSKGRIIDAVARDIGPSVYVDILVATNRKHAALIRDIEENHLKTLSMGCTTQVTTCTKCGNVAADDAELCAHIRYEKGNTFYDENAMPCKVAELCGHHTMDPTGGVRFIEASWVASPAFEGAVLRNIIQPEIIDVQAFEKVLKSPPPQWSPDETTKAAHKMQRVGFDFGDEEEEEPAPKEEEKADPLKDLEKDVEQTILDRVKKNLRDKILKDQQTDALKSEGELGTSSNNNLVKQGSLYQEAIGSIVKTARSEVSMMNRIVMANNDFGIYIPLQIYRASLRVGASRKFSSLADYIKACQKAVGRQISTGEAKTLIRLGHLLSQFERTKKFRR